MATIPTQNAVPSELPQDLKFNAGKIDEFVTSLALKYIDRFGGGHYTIEGIKQLAFEAMSNFGYVTIGSFEDGATLTTPNQALLWESNGEYYKWTGDLPKIVAAGSTPDSSGGIGPGAWLSVGDSLLRSMLASGGGAEMIGLSQGMTAQAAFDQLFTQTQFVTPEQFLANHPGETDWAVMIQDAYDFAIANNKTVLLANVYRVKSSIKHLAGLSVLQTGVIWADPAGDFTTVDAAGNSYKAVYHIMSEGAVYSDKRTYIPRIHIRHTQNIDWGTVYYPHVDAIGVLMTHIAGVVVGQMETWGMLRGGADLGGIPSIGYEVCIMKSCFGIMRWDDSQTVGLRVRTGDSYFGNPVTVDYPQGIVVEGPGNTFVDPHPWGHPKTADNLYPNRQMLIGFDIVSGNNTFIRPYADSVAKLDPNAGATKSNGGYGFIIRSWENMIRYAFVSSHPQQVFSPGLPFFACYFVGDVGRNEFHIRRLDNQDIFSSLPVTWDAGRDTIPWVNYIYGVKAALRTNAALTGNISLNSSALTQTGTYTARRVADYVDVEVNITITSSTGGSGAISMTLPRGLGFYQGAMCQIEDRSAISASLAANTVDIQGVVSTSAGSNITITFYGVLANGSRYNIITNNCQPGSLKFIIRGKISN